MVPYFIQPLSSSVLQTEILKILCARAWELLVAKFLEIKLFGQKDVRILHFERALPNCL